MTAVAIFVKTPGLSLVKTRLAAGIGTSAATAFHLASAHAVASIVRSCQQELTPYWAVAEPDAAGHWGGFPVLWQGEGGLGARMQRIYQQLLHRHGSVLLIGADTPQITSAHLLDAVDKLRCTPYVLGPAHDGGFWLFGGTQPVPTEVWNGTPYSTHVTGSLFAQALKPHGTLGYLDEVTDTDRPEDLPRLRVALGALVHPTPQQTALATWLSENKASP